jgi:hypothetical protein
VCEREGKERGEEKRRRWEERGGVRERERREKKERYCGNG